MIGRQRAEVSAACCLDLEPVAKNTEANVDATTKATIHHRH